MRKKKTDFVGFFSIVRDQAIDAITVQYTGAVLEYYTIIL